MFICFLLGSMWILAPQPGIEPAPPTMEGKVITTGPPGKSMEKLFLMSPEMLESFS